jgi:coproporphyrinogen III oxidase
MTFPTQLRSVTRGMMCVLLVSMAALPTTFGVSRIPLLFASAMTSSSSLSGTGLAAVASDNDDTLASNGAETDSHFEDFVEFLQAKQTEIIQQLEDVKAKESSGATFSRDPWGVFDDDDDNEAGTGNKAGNSGGITRVIQGGSVVEKGACSFTVIRDGILTADRATTIRSRQAGDSDTNNKSTHSIQAGDRYSAAALSMVLHSSHPMVPTFRSHVRVFLVQSASGGGNTLAWFGGGADLTPYYLFEDDVRFFHGLYRDLCDNAHAHLSAGSTEEGEKLPLVFVRAQEEGV